MASEALTIADNNTVKMMYDEMQEEITEMRQTIADLGNTIEDMGNTIKNMDNTITNKDKAIADMQQSNEKLLAEIHRLKSNQ